ncbi:hypothetical protein JKF63_02348 [Porcisia hertigi]|uniref:Uncharacterized protein n=1 Tax=Porcisia hertigi TaxID=2761500 RepID=A0A836H7V0_9TRYP|nr:hypothetical protein JKF63_02348 [Porcisia hertigi]
MRRSSCSVDNGETLIRLDTSLLESRFDSLTQQWDADLRGIRTQIDVCTGDVRSIAADVNAIQHFLASYHHRQMLTALAANPGGTSGDVANAATEGVLDHFVANATDGSPTENVLGMVAVARRLLTENEALRALLDSATTAISMRTTGDGGLRQEMDQMQHQITQQSRVLQNISSSLGMLGLPIDIGTSEANDDCTSVRMNTFTTPTLDGDSTESLLSHSPLLLSFRRILLRDLTERLTSVVDQQSKDFHDAMAHLEGRLRGSQKGATAVVAAQPPGVIEELQATVLSLSKKIKSVQEQALNRDEFSSLMKTKADSLLLPTKADNAALTDLETRLGARFVELEERCAFADAERTEFRKLLRSLIAAQGHFRTSEIPPSSNEVSGANAQMQPTAFERVTLLGDILPGVGNGHAAPAPMPPSKRDGALADPRGATTPRQLYRVCGTSHSIGLHGVFPSSAAQSKNFNESTASQPRADRSVVAIGVTPTQGPYAAFVSEQLTRRHVASLPPLPYEKAPNL